MRKNNAIFGNRLMINKRHQAAPIRGDHMMSKGFITIATGSEQYYRIAANLVKSYRLFCNDPMPFAIACDKEENKYTDLFDVVIKIENPTNTYLDKLLLPDIVPFDENIFIDADCIAYRDLNDFWNLFETASDFSVFGSNYPLEYEYGWFRQHEVGVLSDKVSYIPDFIGGVYFLRKTEQLKAFSETCKYNYDTYHDYRFRQFTDPADEPIYALAMAVHNERTIGINSPNVCFYPHAILFETDIRNGIVKYTDKYRINEGLITGAYMVHWGSGNTRRDRYKLEEYQLEQLTRGRRPAFVELRIMIVIIWIKNMANKLLRKVCRLAFHSMK